MLKTTLSGAGLLSYGFLLVTVPNEADLRSTPGTFQSALALGGQPKQSAVNTVAFRYTSDSVVDKQALREAELEKIPVIRINPKGEKFVRDYLKTNHETLQLVQKKSEPYFRIMDSVFTRYNLPLELKYLAVIESNLKPTAVSRVGAVGTWQLMPETAKILGLKVGKKYDERTHPYKSTVAAAKYLRDLYAIYGDWLLVIAAYNSGPGWVQKAIKRSGSRNFWKLQYHLPEETRLHVKKFIGAHYWFEGKGSITTLTKAEVIAHRKAVEEFMASLDQAKL